jgi:hypothetical protein
MSECFSSLPLKSVAKPDNKSILKKSRHLGFGNFIVHSSMVYTFHNAEVVVDDLGERGEAVGGAGGVGHHVVARLVLLVVHTLQTHLF